jgi:hypothetical protein
MCVGGGLGEWSRTSVSAYATQQMMPHIGVVLARRLRNLAAVDGPGEGANRSDGCSASTLGSDQAQLLKMLCHLLLASVMAAKRSNIVTPKAPVSGPIRLVLVCTQGLRAKASSASALSHFDHFYCTFTCSLHLRSRRPLDPTRKASLSNWRLVNQRCIVQVRLGSTLPQGNWLVGVSTICWRKVLLASSQGKKFHRAAASMFELADPHALHQRCFAQPLRWSRAQSFAEQPSTNVGWRFLLS